MSDRERVAELRASLESRGEETLYVPASKATLEVMRDLDEALDLAETATAEATELKEQLERVQEVLSAARSVCAHFDSDNVTASQRGDAIEELATAMGEHDDYVTGNPLWRLAALAPNPQGACSVSDCGIASPHYHRDTPDGEEVVALRGEPQGAER